MAKKVVLLEFDHLRPPFILRVIFGRRQRRTCSVAIRIETPAAAVIVAATVTVVTDVAVVATNGLDGFKDSSD